ncbi:MAG TPA: DUF2155 domain-containing protein [Stellaceae bacterium]|jgi:hypothetical protein|nr:DUF2155 domain-containing protein [Stellaceae bacterium]
MRLLLAAVLGLVTAGSAAARMSPQPIAVLQGLDKISARTSRFEAPIGASIHFGTLLITVRDCEQSAPEDTPENAAFMQIYETPPGEDTKRLFSGWMFSSSPAISQLEHPVYDVTLLGCKAASTPAPVVPVPPSPPSPEPPSPRGKLQR